MAGSGKAHLLPEDETLIRVEDLVVEYDIPGGDTVKAVSGISFDIKAGETLGLVGESGCGKSTTGKALIQLPKPTSGSIKHKLVELTSLSTEAMRRRRTDLQMIFQDPISSLNPLRKVEDIVAEPMKIWGPKDKSKQQEMVDNILDSVGIDPEQARGKMPHEFSGGQCQRISIARSLILDPEVLICDEPVSALDVSMQAQILNLLEDLKKKYHLTLIFIAHDLAVVKNISDKVAVMYLGKLCEVAQSDELYENPVHPYSKLLLDSCPEPDPGVAIDRTVSDDDELPSPINPPSGCRFRTRCPFATEICSSEEPQMEEIRPNHYVACHHPLI